MFPWRLLFGAVTMCSEANHFHHWKKEVLGCKKKSSAEGPYGGGSFSMETQVEEDVQNMADSCGQESFLRGMECHVL
ncbi:unnamed protein product [Linum tenue]|uniref:Uncharacterized protein n=1 Tax=Linum tenue TaxID=586396 RepID=A0AAV0NM87_9ROSI|nr:unnamed protein product [Linum tenue]